jgi:hypothetical protein
VAFEAVARNEYTKSELKNPTDCSLFYLALKKKTVLQGLWRMAGWNREQGATLRLLSNNFQDPKWRTVALKNAYALLGKRRFGKPRNSINLQQANILQNTLRHSFYLQIA